MDGARPALAALHGAFPALGLIWAASGYAGKLVVGGRWSVVELLMRRLGPGAGRRPWSTVYLARI